MIKFETVDLKVVETRDDGSAVFEIPILPVCEIDRSRTAGGGKGKDKITVEVLEQIAANFNDSPGPVPVGVSPHRDYGARSGFSIAFVEKAFVKKNRLYAHIWCIAGLAYEIKRGGWRGFSVEMLRNPTFPTKKMKGFVLVGGVFTNRPATDVNFKVPADAIAAEMVAEEAEQEVFHQFSLNSPDEGKEKGMPKGDGTAPDAGAATPTPSSEQTVSLEFHERTLQSEKDRVVALEGSNRELSRQLSAANETISTQRTAVTEAERKAQEANNAKLEAEATSSRVEAEAKGLRSENSRQRTQITELEEKVKAEGKVNLSAKVTAVIKEAITEHKVPPRLFEGYESDPANWMESRYANFEAFEKTVRTFRGGGLNAEAQDGGTPSSGHTPGNDPAAERDAGEVSLEEDEQEIFEQLDLDTDFLAEGMDEDKARKLAEKRRAAESASS